MNFPDLVSPFSKMEVNPQSNRRNRLAALRNRMQSEFGGGGMISGMEEDASQSERTSLASWGRTFLMERSNDSSVIAVCPADSQSTKAMPVTNSLFDKPGNPSFNIPQDIPVKGNNNVKFNGTTRATSNQDETMTPTNAIFSPNSPPPSLPPPPLPERPQPLGGSPLVPPPLPPRKSTTSVSSSTTVAGTSGYGSNVTTTSIANSNLNNSAFVPPPEEGLKYAFNSKPISINFSGPRTYFPTIRVP